MKTSNIILSTLIGTITLVIISGALQLRLTGEKKLDYVDKVYSETSLSDFKYIIIKESTNLNIISSNESKLQVYFPPGEKKPQVLFHQQGDTLFIDHIRMGANDRSLFVNVKTPVENVLWIQAKNAAFSVSDFPAKALTIDLNNSRLSIHANSTLKMGTLNINAMENSQIDSHDVSIDTLTIHLDQSQARLPVSIHKLRGTMSHSSSLFANDVSDIEFKKDSSSHLQ